MKPTRGHSCVRSVCNLHIWRRVLSEDRSSDQIAGLAWMSSGVERMDVARMSSGDVRGAELTERVADMMTWPVTGCHGSSQQLTSALASLHVTAVPSLHCRTISAAERPTARFIHDPAAMLPRSALGHLTPMTSSAGHLVQ